MSVFDEAPIADANIREALDGAVRSLQTTTKLDIRVSDLSLSTNEDGDEVILVEMVFSKLPEPGAFNDFVYEFRERLMNSGHHQFPHFWLRTDESVAPPQHV